MLDRRAFIGSGFAALAAGLAARSGLAHPAVARVRRSPSVVPFGASDPVLDIPLAPQSVMIEGIPFAPEFSGDWPQDMVHPPVDLVQHAPPVEETVDVVVVGGGLSGLAAAYMLRDLQPVVLEHQRRFGGAAQGERWAETSYSLGGAYVITPDKGSFLESFYKELGLDKDYRASLEDDAPELNGKFDEAFWNRQIGTFEQTAGFGAYARAVAHFAENYPEIPPSDPKAADALIALDSMTLKQSIEGWIGGRAPELLSSAVQAYCYSSFGAGWEELSAAGGWNFIAAEEYGRWVFPGGNSLLARRLWSGLAEAQRGAGTPMLRAGCRAMDVRLRKGFAEVIYADDANKLHTIRARRVVMACPKYVCKHIIRDLGAIDAPRLDAMHAVHYRAYVVANLLLDKPIERDFYDAFLLGNGVYPHNDGEVAAFSRVTDVVNGHYARSKKATTSVLTCYWPLPWGTARFTLVPSSEPLKVYGASLAARVDGLLGLFGLDRSALRQVRLCRWGHAMPVCSPGLIASGVVGHLRRPLDGVVYFVQQDNWALPAVENSLLDAKTYTDELRAGL